MMTRVWLHDLLQFWLNTTQNDSAKSNGPHWKLGNSSVILLTKADCSLTIRPGERDMVPLQQQFSVCPIPQLCLSSGYQSSDAHSSRFLYSQLSPFSQDLHFLHRSYSKATMLLKTKDPLGTDPKATPRVLEASNFVRIR